MLNKVKDFKISVALLFYIMAGYLYLPLFIFLFGWVTPVIAVVIGICSFAGIYYALRNIWKEKRNDVFSLSMTELCIVFLFFVGFCIFVGQGDFFPQDFDWHKHHAIFNDLLNYSWPVIYDNDSMLTYYLGQYLVPAFVAKLLFHSQKVLRLANPLWNALGLTLVYAFIVYYLRLDANYKKLVALALMVFWGGCTNLGQTIYRLLGYDVRDAFSGNYKWIDMSRIRVYFASNYDALYGAFQHVIPAWISCCLFLGNRKHKEAYVLMSLPLMFSATFGFVYFVVLLLFFAVWDWFNTRDKKQILCAVFSRGNILLVPLALIVLVYLCGNFLGPKPDSVGLKIINMTEYADFYIIFILVEFIGYCIFLFSRNCHNALFYAIIVELLIMPLFSLGMFTDLCSRGSIPARFILMILCMEQLYHSDMKKWRNIWLMTLLLVAALNTEVQMWAHVNKTIAGWKEKTYLADDYKTLEGFAGNPEVREDNAYNYFTLGYSDSLFQKIARRK